MFKYKWYRLFRVILGYRSFVKVNEEGTNTYILIKGLLVSDMIEKLISDGYVEEWPIERVNNG